MSIMDSSDDEVSLRMARKAAIRTLSSALDHSSKHFYPHPHQQWINKYCLFAKNENKGRG
jgi:hypothetical protein